MSALVYQAINAVTAELATSGIAKSRHNEAGDYAYRGIEDVLNALAPLLGRHKLCVLPRVLEREAVRARAGEQLIVLRVAFDLVSAIDGSSHVVESFGEAIDDSDKGSAKAMSAAYKAAMLQAFCVPVPQGDGDAFSPRMSENKTTTILSLAEPPQGWESWVREVMDIAGSCETAEAVERLLAGRRDELSALQRARPECYAKMGEAIASRLAELQRPATAKPAAQELKSAKPKSSALASEPTSKGMRHAKRATAQAA
jgi:hypothetical protein